MEFGSVKTWDLRTYVVYLCSRVDNPTCTGKRRSFILFNSVVLPDVVVELRPGAACKAPARCECGTNVISASTLSPTFTSVSRLDRSRT